MQPENPLPPEATLRHPGMGPDLPAKYRRAVTPRCRCCDRRRLQWLGQLPDASVFAGTRLKRPLAGGALYRCLDCAFVFRAPICSKKRYDALYRAGAVSAWEKGERTDHALVRQALTRHLRAGKVIDIGCSSGSLLMPLTKRYETFGAEINAASASIAESRGIRILAGDIADVAQLPYLFDAVISCDVIEHVVNPLEFMHTLLSKTRSQGIVIISTGNAACWSWRLFGSRFWYCYLPEHISFISPRWFKRYTRPDIFAHLDADIIETRRFVYGPEPSWLAKAIRFIGMAMFRLSPALYYRLLPQAKQQHIPVGRGITRDHFLTVLRKR